MKLRRFAALLVVLSLAFGLSALAAEFDASKEIAVVSREEGSGTRGAFIELTGVQAKNDAGEEVDNTTLEADFVNGTNLVMSTVAGNEYAIGYASLASVEGNETVKAVKVNGGEGSTENILNKTYVVARPFNVVTTKDLTDEVALDFFAFLLSTEGQAVVGGTYQIGMASRELKDNEIEAGAIGTVLAMDGISVIVYPSNPIENLEREQVRQVFVGEVTTWAELDK